MTRAEKWSPIIIRRSEIIDAPALRRLAALDSRRLPAGTFLIAEIDGEIVAAAPIENDEPTLADPFRPTEDIAHMLELHARSLRRPPVAA